MTTGAAHPRLAVDVAGLVATAAGGTAVVMGSLPPEGRDLDLLVRRPERERLEAALAAAGLVRRGSTFARFASCSAYAVELIDPSEVVPPAVVDELFAAAVPITGLEPLAQPAPEHTLLILAHLFAREGRLSPARRARLDRALAAEPDAWERAAATACSASGHLRQLQHAASQNGRHERGGLPVRATRATFRRWGLLVSLSGIDGAGKSSQSRWLRDALLALGVDAQVVWNDLQGNLAADVLAQPAKALLRATRRSIQSYSSYEEPAVRGSSPAAPPGRGIWSSVVTLTDALEQRVRTLSPLARGHVVIFDRGPLDLAVRMEVLYRVAPARQRRIIELAAPRPGAAFLLDIPAEVSLARKHDIWSRTQLEEQAAMYRSLASHFGVRRIDGRLAPDVIAAEIAQTVWQLLP